MTNATEEKSGYYFCFEGTDPITTDPGWFGKIKYGRQNVVTLDGVDVEGLAVEFKTGPNGWVRKQLGIIRYHPDSEFLKKYPNGYAYEYDVVTGNVEFKEDWSRVDARPRDQ